MRNLIVLSVFMAFTLPLNAQFLKKLGDKAVDAVERTVERRVENEASKRTNEAIDGVLKGDKKTPKEKEKNNEKSSTSNSNKEIKVVKESDFIAGTNLIFIDDFQKDAKGDFPAKWNTNGSGEVVEIEGTKWLALNHNSIAHPELTKPLPENVTISFDLLMISSKTQTTPHIQFGLSQSTNILKEKMDRGNFFVQFRRFENKNQSSLEYGLKANVLGNKNDFNLSRFANEILHVDLAINGSRIRVYLDGEKIIDLPKAITTELRNMFYINNSMVIPATQTPVYISNLKIASSEKDARSAIVKDLFESGTASTSDIYFDSGKSNLKSGSQIVLDELGNALKESTFNVLIIGHTDSDGAEESNQKLSEERAKSVKNYLTSKFGINANRIITSGKGESEPITSNATEDGKKQNRRVEFKKL
jgi:OOP family OmpA-OmpF porin